MKRGVLDGEAAPERPCLEIKNPVGVTDLHATIFTAGVSPQTAFDVEGRPFDAIQGGKGRR